jgi:hypothetical protein
MKVRGNKVLEDGELKCWNNDGKSQIRQTQRQWEASRQTSLPEPLKTGATTDLLTVRRQAWRQQSAFHPW